MQHFMLMAPVIISYILLPDFVLTFIPDVFLHWNIQQTNVGWGLLIEWWNYYSVMNVTKIKLICNSSKHNDPTAML